MNETNPRPFDASQFTSTQFNSAEQKAKFGNNLVKFILNGFQSKDFTPALYKALNNCFGHIAHYDIRGFYETWFSDHNQVREWFDHVQQYTPVGSAEFTFSDVERAFKTWFSKNLKDCSDQIVSLSNAENEMAELAGTKQIFRIAAISSNTGSFGHKRHILVSKHGIAVEAERMPNNCNPSNRDLTSGEELTFTVDAEGMPTDYQRQGFETLSRMRPEPPQAVIDQIFSAKIVLSR